MYRFLYLFVFFIICSGRIIAQPQPGDIFRDYVWKTPDNSQKFLRVIADGDYRTPVGFRNELPEEVIKDGWLTIHQLIDVSQAVSAEFQIEMLLSHDETTGLAVKFNDGNWHEFNMPEKVPEPKANYLQHNYPVIPIPLSDLKEGVINRFRFRVDSIQRWNMPQNIIYGTRLRIYYNEKKKHPDGTIKEIAVNSVVEEIQNLELSTKSDIVRVDYIGNYTDVDFAGDGVSSKWHYSYYRGEMRNHIGTSATAPFGVSWNTSWLPDQPKPMSLSAIVTDKSGMSYFLPPVDNLSLNRNFSVELAYPFEIPQRWATREKTFEQKIQLQRNPETATEFQLAFVSWSPAYLNGIYVNDWLMPTFEDCDYCYGVHRLTSRKTFFLKQGTNIISTGKTPLVRGKMVHGAEIIFPGMMLLVKYPKPAVSISEMEYLGTPHFKVETPTAIWYIEKKSGGCSSLIDQNGNDWIKFRKDGNDGPSLSSDSDFRGLPNLVFKDPGDGIGHPGFDKCKTTKLLSNELLVTSNDQKWQFRWVFHAGYAEIIIEKTDSNRNYWFLYEGPVTGKFSPGSHFWGNNRDGLRTDRPSIFKNPESGNWDWVFFGDRTSSTTLFVSHTNPDNIEDFFAYMGNNQQSDIYSIDGMNVFGFGRAVKTAPLMNGPNRFIVGLFPEQITGSATVEKLKHFISEISY